MVIGSTDGQTGDELTTSEVDGEHAVLVLDGATLQVNHDGQVVSVDEPAVVIVPPGSSSLKVMSPGTVIRVLAAATAPALAARCANASEYEDSDANVATFTPWPDPPEVTASACIHLPSTRLPRGASAASSAAQM